MKKNIYAGLLTAVVLVIIGCMFSSVVLFPEIIARIGLVIIFVVIVCAIGLFIVVIFDLIRRRL